MQCISLRSLHIDVNYNVKYYNRIAGMLYFIIREAKVSDSACHCFMQNLLARMLYSGYERFSKGFAFSFDVFYF